MAEIGKWTLKLTRLVETSSQPFSSFVNSQLFIHAGHLSFIVHFLNNTHFLLCFEQDRAHEYRAQFLHYFLFHMLNQVPHAHSLTSSSNLLLDLPYCEDCVDKHLYIFF
jgi:hypothetical protein